MLATLKSDALNDPEWQTSYKPVHGVNTSVMGGYKFGSRLTSAGKYQVALFTTSGKRLVTGDNSPWAVLEWDDVPSGEDILQAFLNVCPFCISPDECAELNCYFQTFEA